MSVPIARVRTARIPGGITVDKYGTARQATDGPIIRRRKDAICMQDDLHSKYVYLLLFDSNNVYANALQC